MSENIGKYSDIINLPHHVSKRHPSMPMIKRAAQFAPFAALTGYDDAVEETARVTDEMVVLTEERFDELNRMIRLAIKEKCMVRIDYFEPDKKKTGGSFRELTGRIRKVEMDVIFMDDGMRVMVDRVVKVENI